MRPGLIKAHVFAALLFSICFLFLLCIYPDSCSAAAKAAVETCLTSVIPALFPILAVSNLCVALGICTLFERFAGGAMRVLFRLPGALSPALVLGFLGGYPVGARTAGAIYQKGLCQKADAEYALSFVNNSGPGFVLGLIGGYLFQSPFLGFFIYLIHLLSAVLTGFILARFRAKKPRARSAGPALQAVSFAPAFISSIKTAFTSVCLISAFILFFSVFLNLLDKIGVLCALSRLLGVFLTPLGFSACDTAALSSGFFEMTSGLLLLRASSSALSVRLTAACVILSFGGLCIHCQTVSCLSDTGLSTRLHFFGKLLQSAFCFLLCPLLCRFLPVSITSAAFSSSGEAPSFTLLLTVCRVSLLALFTLLFIRRLNKSFLRS